MPLNVRTMISMRNFTSGLSSTLFPCNLFHLANLDGVSARLKSLAPPPDVEPLFPGALWVGIAALSGSILAPKRSIIRRIIYPPAWGFLAALYFLPLTTSNVGKYIVELEDRYIPSVAKRQKELAAQLRAGLADGRERTKKLRGDFAGQVDRFTGMVRERTGLKVGEKEEDKDNK
jgi:MICOS complex subunit MIC26